MNGSQLDEIFFFVRSKLSFSFISRDNTRKCRKFISEKQDAPRGVAEEVRTKLTNFMENLGILHALCNPGLRPRHWEEISAVVRHDGSHYWLLQIIKRLFFGSSDSTWENFAAQELQEGTDLARRAVHDSVYYSVFFR